MTKQMRESYFLITPFTGTPLALFLGSAVLPLGRSSIIRATDPNTARSTHNLHYGGIHAWVREIGDLEDVKMEFRLTPSQLETLQKYGRLRA